MLEVADSVVANGGRGLFIRCLGEETESVTLEEGTAVCGYAEGSMRTSAESDKSVAFALASVDSVVWFERELRTVADVLADESIVSVALPSNRPVYFATCARTHFSIETAHPLALPQDSIAGHIVAYDDASAQALDIGLDASYDGPRYFVPAEPQPSPLPITALGQMANDLAVGDLDDEAGEEAYEEISEVSNLLVLVFRLERDENNPRLLVPSRPISTTGRSITFVNDVPMELGCRYGRRYWKNWKDAAALRACLDASGD